MSKGTAPSVRAAYEVSNLKAAEIIAQDPVRYDGIMLEWAERMLNRLPSTANSRDGGCRQEGAELLHGNPHVGGTGQ